MAAPSPWSQAEGMTSTTLRALAAAGALALALTGCSAGGGVSIDDIVPDGPAKQKARDSGQPFIHSPPLRDQILSEIPVEGRKKK